MSRNRLSAIFLLLMLFLAACGPATITTTDIQLLPSPSGPWDVSLAQTGGIAGVQLKVEVSSDGRLTAQDLRSGKKTSTRLDSTALDRLSGLVSAFPASAPQLPPSKCADCFLYDLQISSGGRTVHVQADDTTLAATGAQKLIDLLQQLRDAALKSQP